MNNFKPSLGIEFDDNFLYLLVQLIHLNSLQNT